MPSISDILQVAQALEKKPFLVLEDRCVKVLNRNASCTRCQDVCPAGDVISIKVNTITVDTQHCSSCGACIPVCPTEALVSLSPADDDLSRHSTSALQACEGKAAILACARIASKRQADAQMYAEVPCLGRIDAARIVDLACSGAEKVLLVDGVCKTCKYHATQAVTDNVINDARAILQAMGSSATVEQLSGFPDKLTESSDKRMYAAERRRFFSFATTSARDAAKSTVSYMLKTEQEQRSLRARIGVDSNGKRPRFTPPRHAALLDAIDGERLRRGLGASTGEASQSGSEAVEANDNGADGASVNAASEQIETHLWGNVSINMELCNGCGMCAVFCPTGALKKSSVQSDDHQMSFDFSAADCVQCGLCADVCIKKCLTVSPIVPIDELLDFEPRVMKVPVASGFSSAVSANPYTKS